uniref:Putative secreted protein synganglion overexpressed n=1 Tax=Rhipicephalus microplus TaxID=6941 RepID=A0A6M2DDU2_RHIMP
MTFLLYTVKRFIYRFLIRYLRTQNINSLKTVLPQISTRLNSHPNKTKNRRIFKVCSSIFTIENMTESEYSCICTLTFLLSVYCPRH